MEPDTGEASLFQQSLHSVIGCLRTGGLLWLQRVREDPLGQGGFFPLPEKLRCAGREDDGAGAGGSLGVPCSQLATLLLMDSAAYLKGAIRLIEVCPLEATDLSPAQASGEFRVEEVVPDIILLNDCHEYIQLFIC